MTDSEVRHRNRARILHRVHRGVYTVGHPNLTWEGRLMAAVLASGPGGVTSHRTAADLLGIRPSQSRRIDVTVPAGGGRLPPSAVRLYRSTALPVAEITAERGIPVTTSARTLLDLAAVVDRRSLERAVERAEMLHIFDLTAIQAVLRAHPRRAGSRALRGVLEAWAPLALTRSELEDRFLAMCTGAGIERPLVNVRVGPYEVDFLWPKECVIAETDGHAYHRTRAAFERDHARDAHLTAAGYRVVRFTYRQVTHEPALVVGVLRSVLASEGASR